MHSTEFQEIAHCGGRITIEATTLDGRRGYQTTFRHLAPTPAALYDIYALPQGYPVGSGGDPPVPGCFQVFIASDSEGMFGHECPGCKRYWRTRGAVNRCPYCGRRGKRHQFLTTAQRRYVTAFCSQIEDALCAEEDGKFVINMDAVADAAGKDCEKPPFYYAEERQQNLFQCDACGESNDVLGTYAYCSVCGTRNDLQELEKKIAALRACINAGGPYEGCAKDAVALFDSFADQYAKQLLWLVPITPARRGRLEQARFHHLTSAAALFLSIFDIDLLRGMSEDDRAFASLMFHRRHVYEHKGGEADEKYIADSGDTSVRPKQALRESQASAHRIANAVLMLGRNLHEGFHAIFPPLKEWTEIHAKRKASRKS